MRTDELEQEGQRCLRIIQSAGRIEPFPKIETCDPSPTEVSWGRRARRAPNPLAEIPEIVRLAGGEFWMGQSDGREEDRRRAAAGLS